MITGAVNAAREARIQITIFGGDGSRQVEAIIDTGFTGFLTLSSELIAELDCEWLCRQEAMLADGKTHIFDVFLGEVQWAKGPAQVAILASEGTSLIGMSMIEGHKLEIEVVESGHVRLTPL